jgi:hypothetical protein
VKRFTFTMAIVIFALTQVSVFAGDPIPGIDVVVIKNNAPTRAVNAPNDSAGAGGSGGLPGAAINTSRSNIKRPGVTAAANGSQDTIPSAVSTSRSNIKRPGVTANDSDAIEPTAAPVKPGAATKKPAK